MSDEEFNDWLTCPKAAENWLQAAFELMDGIEGIQLDRGKRTRDCGRSDSDGPDG